MDNTQSISAIAREIKREWANVNYAAKPYLNAMLSIDSPNDSYGAKWAREWRQRCRDNAAKAKKRPTWAKGMIVKLGEHEYVLHSSAGARKGWYVRLLNGHGTGSLYRASAKQLNNATIIQGV